MTWHPDQSDLGWHPCDVESVQVGQPLEDWHPDFSGLALKLRDMCCEASGVCVEGDRVSRINFGLVEAEKSLFSCQAFGVET